MVKSELRSRLEEQINSAAKAIIDKKNIKLDHIANGKLGYLLSLRRVLDNKATKEDLGLHDAVNDVLQLLGFVDSKKTYLSDVK
ncbi:hypothetical protein [Pseudomonas sp. TWI628]|uniref:hypothetical protein n=1 Tax=Pseudomonas sp. TWI628 TaxID=3136788 RepID=UPI00320B53F4